MVAIGVLAVLTVSAMEIARYVSDAVMRQRLLSTRARVIENLTRISGMPAAIRASLHDAANGDLKRCAKGTGEPCLGDVQFRGFRLYLPFVEFMPDGRTLLVSGAITGTTDHPIRYDYRGGVCDTHAAACPPEDYPIEVTTEFSAVCPPAFHEMYDDDLRGGQPYFGPIFSAGLQVPKSCDWARYIKVRLTIKPSDDSDIRPGLVSSVNFKRFEKVQGIDAQTINFASAE